jgi:hypothetical protein
MDVKKVNNMFRVVADTEQLQKMLQMGQITEEGILYDFELAGPQGADYFLFPAKHHSEEDVQKSKDYLRTNQDVVSLLIGHVEGEYPIDRYPPEWTPEQREAGFRKIVDERSYGQVENCPFVDLYTASTVVQIIDALSPERKAKFLSVNAYAMIDLTWKVVGRTSA